MALGERFRHMKRASGLVLRRSPILPIEGRRTRAGRVVAAEMAHADTASGENR